MVFYADLQHQLLNPPPAIISKYNYENSLEGIVQNTKEGSQICDSPFSRYALLEGLERKFENTITIPILSNDNIFGMVQYDIMVNPKDNSIVGALVYNVDKNKQKTQLNRIIDFRGNGENVLIMKYEPDTTGESKFDWRNHPEYVVGICEDKSGAMGSRLINMYKRYQELEKEEKDLEKRKQERRKYRGPIMTAKIYDCQNLRNQKLFIPTKHTYLRYRRWF